MVEAFARALEARVGCRSSCRTSGCRATKPKRGWRVRERDWRKRKTKLDAAAAAVILQDYLDGPSAR